MKCESTVVLWKSSYVLSRNLRNQAMECRQKTMKKDIAPNLHHNSQLPISLGCIHCPERKLCGGLQVYGDHYDCLVFCDCTDRRTCTLACPNNLETYLERHQEVRGFTLGNIPRTPSYPVCDL